MSKLKSVLPNLFGSKKNKKPVKDKKDKNKNIETTPTTISTPAATTVAINENVGRLETDAVVISNGENNNANITPAIINGHAASSPTVSAELTASAIRELNDPNYNSMELAQSPAMSNALAIRNTELQHTHNNIVGITNNTLAPTTNVNNAQQQFVVQISNANKLHFGSVYNFNNNTNATSTMSQKGVADETATEMGIATQNDVTGSRKRIPVRKTTTVVAMMQSQEEPNHRILDTISTHLGEGWKQVMRDLGHSEGQIDQALIDHHMHGGIKEVIHQLLLQWLQNADDNVATLGHITVLLWETNHRDCVQRMKLVWKTDEKTRKISVP